MEEVHFFICIEDGRSHNLLLDHYSADDKTQTQKEGGEGLRFLPNCPAWGQEGKRCYCHLENKDGSSWSLTQASSVQFSRSVMSDSL